MEYCQVPWYMHSKVVSCRSTIHHLFALRHFIPNSHHTKQPLFVDIVDLQKAHGVVQHDLLWARLQTIRVGPCMLAAMEFWYSSGTFSIKIDGTRVLVSTYMTDKHPCKAT